MSTAAALRLETREIRAEDMIDGASTTMMTSIASSAMTSIATSMMTSIATSMMTSIATSAMTSIAAEGELDDKFAGGACSLMTSIAEV